MRRALFVLLLAPACFNPSYHDPTCGPGGACPSGYTCVDQTCRSMVQPPDAPESDVAVVVPPDASYCLGSTGWEICTGVAPTADVVLPSTIDTATSPLCDTTATWGTPGQPDACVIAGTSITASTTVRVTGTRPLVLYATSTISIAAGATLDAAGHRTGPSAGPGAPSASCVAFAANPADSTTGAGGGAGATFMSKGGDGGLGGNGAVHGSPGAPQAAPTTLRAGCTGQNGAMGNQAVSPGGVGGGAVYLVAGGSIAVNGTITVSGAGGLGGSPVGGGAGGGGGGMLVLAAPAITGTGTLIANGGGGGGGGGGTPGSPGADPTLPTTPAMGGNGGSGNGCGAAADGGTGFAGTIQAASGLAGSTGSMCGGGGGGGGAGYIRASVAVPDLVASPAVSVL